MRELSGAEMIARGLGMLLAESVGNQEAIEICNEMMIMLFKLEKTAKNHQG